MIAGTGNEVGGGLTAMPGSFWQCRVTPDLGKKFKNHPVNYDSTIIFPVKEMADKYMALYIKQLYELGILKPKQKYDSQIIQLATYLPPMNKGAATYG